ncbi:phenol hydroxylase subunit P4 [Rugamonas apoptosis]|uniref:Phenol hydroxylase subunit P4 n=1 Tax=Rugamonas apoptosis TaxID=2758570 RepID=A0A7W2FDQ3_9BURK|nr:phenol hydroxylase subunit P4 [Rugamonas apoptosis]MBA5689842.1 phenol hydroxylase subunit P4 [Rugamonas apoptosis]
MAVTAIKDYIGVPRDTVANFNGRQLVYASWDRHSLFASPFLLCMTPETKLGEVVETMLVPLMQADPDAAAVDWDKVEWLKSNQPWTPDFSASVAANGIGHKDQIRFRTPGLNTLCADA